MTWPAWLALALAGTVFIQLRHPAAARHRTRQQTAAVPAEILWVERAVAAAAAAHHADPGTPIAAESWRLHLDPQAPPALRSRGFDAFGHPYGPQVADRTISLDAKTRETLESLASKETGSSGH